MSENSKIFNDLTFEKDQNMEDDKSNREFFHNITFMVNIYFFYLVTNT